MAEQKTYSSPANSLFHFLLSRTLTPCCKYIHATIQPADARVLGCGQRRFVSLKTARQLLTAVFAFTRAFAPCSGQDPDHRRGQACQRSDKPYQLNNQVHGQLTSFLQGRRCQHTGLIPLTSSNYITKSNTRSLFVHIDSDRKAA